MDRDVGVNARSAASGTSKRGHWGATPRGYKPRNSHQPFPCCSWEVSESSFHSQRPDGQGLGHSIKGKEAQSPSRKNVLSRNLAEKHREIGQPLAGGKG